MATRKKGSSNNGRNPQQAAGNAKDQLSEQLSERAAEMAEYAEEMAQHAQRMAHQADRRFRSAVDRRPATAIWTSFGVGVGLGLVLVALASSRREDEWTVGGWSMDDLSGSVGDLRRRAETMGRSAAHQASDYAQDVGRSASRRAREAASSLGF